MSTIDMQGTPGAAGTIFTAQNGVQYQWDGQKWIAYIQPAASENFWERGSTPGSEFLAPLNLGDDVIVRDTGGNVTAKLEASDGSLDATTLDVTTIECTGLTVQTQKVNGTVVATINSSGLLTVENISMETFPDLPD